MADQKEKIRAEELYRRLYATKKDGSRRFSDAEIRELLPLVLLCCQVPRRFADWSEPVRQIMQAFAEHIGATESMSPEAFFAAVDAYYSSHPPNSQLLGELRRFFHDEQAQAGQSDANPAFARLLGESRAIPADGKAPVPADAIRGGPWARHDLDKK